MAEGQRREPDAEAANDHYDAVSRAAMPDDFVTRLFLVRHGEVQGMGAREVRGQRDVGLSARGEAQHAALAGWLAARLAPDGAAAGGSTGASSGGPSDAPSDAPSASVEQATSDGATPGARRPLTLLTSDLSRCRLFAEELAAALATHGVRVAVAVEPALREQHMGTWQGQTWEAITAREGRAINDYWDDYWNAAPPSGESMADMAARVRAWWDGRSAALAGHDVVVVTHAGPIRALLAGFLGVPGEEALRFAPPPATASVVAHSAAGFVLEGLGLGPDAPSAARILPGSQASPAGAREPEFDRAIEDGASATYGREARRTTESAADRAHRTPPAAAASVSVPSSAHPVPAPPLRIAVSGSAGTGKTTLGRALAGALDLPFIEERMRLRLEQGLELGRMSHAELEALHRDLWAEQVALEAAHPGGFVVDRSSLDYAAFRLQYGFFDDGFDTAGFFAQAVAHAASYTAVLLFPHGALPLETDGVRAPNPWLQLRFQLCVEGLLDAHLDPARLHRVPRTDSFQDRLTWAQSILERR